MGGKDNSQARRIGARLRRFALQAYLNFSGIKYKLVPSSNHGSPSGILPFMQPAAAAKDSSATPDAVPSNKLRKWAMAQSSTSIQESDDTRYEAYESLVSNALRRAWVSCNDRMISRIGTNGE